MAKENRHIKFEKNPLAQAFGLALKKMRGDAQSASVAEALGVSNSFIRLLEIGSTNIHTSKVLKLLGAFPKIEFQALTKILITITITDQYKESVGIYRMGLRDIIEASKDSKDRKFENLIQTLITIIDEFESNPSDLEGIMIGKNYADEIIDFLTTIQSPIFIVRDSESDHDKDDDDSKFETLLNDTPSIYVDTISHSLNSLRRINPNLFAQDSSDWETENSPNFKRLVAVIKDFNRILRPGNLENFVFKYLLNDDFKDLRYIILNQEKKTSDDWESEFADALNKRWRESKNKVAAAAEKLSRENAFKKIKIKKGNPHDPEIIDFLKTESKQGASEILWIFVTTKGNKIGFNLHAKAAEPDKVYGETLTYEQTRLKFVRFNSLWKKIK